MVLTVRLGVIHVSTEYVTDLIKHRMQDILQNKTYILVTAS